MAANESSLITQAETIRDETTTGANTATRVGTYMRELITWLTGEGAHESLGAEPTAWDIQSKYKAKASASYTANATLTLSNVTKLREFSMQITNTNANTIAFEGATLYFKADDLPDGMSFAANALTFPADSAVVYNLVGYAFDGSTFDCKIEIR
jgi:uncharacterized protein (DUF1786 family)